MRWRSSLTLYLDLLKVWSLIIICTANLLSTMYIQAGGADFIESPVRVIFQPNSKWATVEIPIVDDSDTEENETFTATLFDNECTITIEDNDHIRPKKSAIYCTFSVCVGTYVVSNTCLQLYVQCNLRF